MEKSVKIFNDTDELSHFFAQQMIDRIRKTAEGDFFSIALSGGSTPRSVFSYLAANHKEMIDWRKILVFWSDERCVAAESEESNFRLAKESLFDQVSMPAGNIFRIKGEANPDEEAVRYEEVVKLKVTPNNPVPKFDFVMLGLGEDGHTASIFPGRLDLFKSERLFEVAEHPLTKQKRITATGKLINHAKTVVILVTGENKSEMAARILERQAGWEQLPASFVHPEGGKILWLLDQKAAKYLHMSKKEN